MGINMKWLGLALALWAFPAQAQTTFTMPPPAGVTVVGIQVVASCGAASLTANALAYLAMDTTGKLCTNSSGGGGGAVTIANGADVALGSTTDAACGTSTGTCTLIALIKYLNSIGIPVAGASSNASSAVATSSTNIPSVSYNYGFNGTTWDQLQVDGSKNLKVGPQYSGDIIINPSNSFTRPANTTAYASGQLVANNVTAGSVVPLTWTASRIATGNFRVTRAHMTLSSKSVTNTNFRLHLFNLTTGVSNGDGGTFLPSLAANEVCEMDITIALAGADVSTGYGAANQGVSCDVALGSGSALFGLIEARAAYTPASAETVTVVLEIHQN